MAKKMVSCFKKLVRKCIHTLFNFFIQLELLHLSWKCNTDIEQDRKKKTRLSLMLKPRFPSTLHKCSRKC